MSEGNRYISPRIGNLNFKVMNTKIYHHFFGTVVSPIRPTFIVKVYSS